MRRVEIGIIVALTTFLVAAAEWQFLGQYSPTGHIEVAAVFFTGICVFLAAKNSMWTWPTGIVGCALYFYLFREWGLYADMGLQIVYLVLGVVGWITWLRIRNDDAKPEAKQASLLHLGIVAACVTIGTLLVSDYLREINGTAPFWDALFTSGSLGAQYLLIRKYIENWYLWAMLDLGYVILFFSRDLYLTAALYAVFFVVVIMAAIEWRQYLPKNEEWTPKEKYRDSYDHYRRHVGLGPVGSSIRALNYEMRGRDSL